MSHPDCPVGPEKALDSLFGVHRSKSSPLTAVTRKERVLREILSGKTPSSKNVTAQMSQYRSCVLRQPGATCAGRLPRWAPISVGIWLPDLRRPFTREWWVTCQPTGDRIAPSALGSHQEIVLEHITDLCRENTLNGTTAGDYVTEGTWCRADEDLEIILKN